MLKVSGLDVNIGPTPILRNLTLKYRPVPCAA